MTGDDDDDYGVEYLIIYQTQHLRTLAHSKAPRIDKQTFPLKGCNLMIKSHKEKSKIC